MRTCGCGRDRHGPSERADIASPDLGGSAGSIISAQRPDSWSTSAKSVATTEAPAPGEPAKTGITVPKPDQSTGAATEGATPFRCNAAAAALAVVSTPASTAAAMSAGGRCGHVRRAARASSASKARTPSASAGARPGLEVELSDASAAPRRSLRPNGSCFAMAMFSPSLARASGQTGVFRVR